jgi:beta-barrel assembly-enhancing protease
MRTGLEIVTDEGRTLWWPLREIKQSQGFYAGEQVRLERGGELPEMLLLDDVAFLAALRREGAERARAFHDPDRRRFRVPLTVVAAAAVVMVGAALYLWGIPALAAVVARRVPVAWEERLGASVMEHFAPDSRRCNDPVVTKAVNDIMARLLAPLPSVPYRFRVSVIADERVNAVAAPGGYVFVLAGLLSRAETPEELAGVLAHEAQHVLRRHATRAILQHASTGVLVAALAGDVSGLVAFGLESARTLGALRYSRQIEEEADREGMAMLHAARVDPAGALAFFEKLQREHGGDEIFRYLSTHPSTGDRLRTLRALAAGATVPPLPLLPGQDWAVIRTLCGR